jgi:hypothetical protein
MLIGEPAEFISSIGSAKGQIVQTIGGLAQETDRFFSIVFNEREGP